jgi:hypothetical protein
MKEARIECLVREFPIHDLKLRLRKGQVEFVDETKAKGSKDLANARRLGAVRVRFVERSRVSKQPPRNPPPPNVRLKKARRGGGKPPAPAPAPTVDMDEVRRVAREEARAGAKEGVEEALADFKGQPGVDQATIEAALRNVLPGYSVPAASSGGTSSAPAPVKAKGPEEPVFIPKAIVSKDAKELEVSSESSDAGDLDAAAAALKAAKPKRKRTSRKKPAAKKEGS